MMLRLITAAALTAFTAIGLAQAQENEPANLRFQTGVTGGNWFAISTGIAKIVSDEHPEINISAVPSGFTAGVRMVGTGEGDLAVSLTPQVADARAGREPFREAMPNLKVLFAGFAPLQWHFAVAEDFPADSFQAVVEQKMPISLALPSQRMVSWSVAQKVFEFYELTPDALLEWGGTWQHASFDQGVKLYQDRKVDGMMYIVSAPAPLFKEAQLARPLKFLPFSDDLIDKMVNEYGFQPAVIPEEAYEGAIDEDVQTFAAAAAILIGEHVPDSVAYRIAKVMSENAEKIRALHSSVSDFDPAQHARADHPGATKYFREAGYIKE